MDNTQPPGLSHNYQSHDNAPRLIDDVRPTPYIALTLRHHREMPPDFHSPGHTPERSLIDDPAAVQRLRRNAVDLSTDDRPHSPSRQQRRNAVNLSDPDSVKYGDSRTWQEFNSATDQVRGDDMDLLFDAHRSPNAIAPTANEIRSLMQHYHNNSNLPTYDAFKTSGMHAVDIADLAEDRRECPICYDQYYQGHRPVKLPCGHEYGKECIEHWLTVGKTCPTCRKKLFRGSGPLQDSGELIDRSILHHTAQQAQTVGERTQVAQEAQPSSSNATQLHTFDDYMPIDPSIASTYHALESSRANSLLSANGPEPRITAQGQMLPQTQVPPQWRFQNRPLHAGPGSRQVAAASPQFPNSTQPRPRQRAELLRQNRPTQLRSYTARLEIVPSSHQVAPEFPRTDVPSHVCPGLDYTRRPQNTPPQPSDAPRDQQRTAAVSDVCTLEGLVFAGWRNAHGEHAGSATVERTAEFESRQP